MVDIDDSRLPPSQQHSRHMSDSRDFENRIVKHYPPSTTRGRKSLGESPIGDDSRLQRSASGSRQPRRSRSQGRQAISNLPMDPPSDSDSRYGESAIMVKRKGLFRRFPKFPMSFGNQRQNDERQVTNSPKNHDERIHARGSFLPVLHKSKPLEMVEITEQFSIPRASSPRSVEENTEEEEEDNSEVENTGAPNEHDPTDPSLEGKAVDDSMEEKLQRLEAKLRAVQQQRRDQVKELKGTVAFLRDKLSDKSSGSVRVPIQLPLYTPHGDIINAWYNLGFDVRNLVGNHFKGSKESKMVAWAQRQKDHLQELTPYYVETATDKKCATAFVEAAIWNALCMCTFGLDAPDAPFFWAGKHKRNMASLSGRFLSDVRKLKSGQHKAMLHQWEALTANLISVTVSKEDRDKENAGITEDLNEFLDGLASSLNPRAHRTMLRTIVDKAVDLGMRLCAQEQNRYHIDWVCERRYDVDLDVRFMKLERESPNSTRVRFMVRPGLFCYKDDGLQVIDSCRVWAV